MLKPFETALNVRFGTGEEYLGKYKNNTFRMGITF